jgi:ATP-dependent protease ClpP protease subunit
MTQHRAILKSDSKIDKYPTKEEIINHKKITTDDQERKTYLWKCNYYIKKWNKFTEKNKFEQLEFLAKLTSDKDIKLIVNTNGFVSGSIVRLDHSNIPSTRSSYKNYCGHLHGVSTTCY